jgi:hypothetical protein
VPVTKNFGVVWEESNKTSWSFSNDSSPHEVSRFAQVPDDQQDLFIRAMLGYSELKGVGGVHRVLPESHPRWSWLYATNVRFIRETGEPFDTGPDASLKFDAQELEVVYRSLEWSIQADEAIPPALPGQSSTELYRYIHRQKNLAVHAQIIPRNAMEFVEENPPLSGKHDPVPEPGSIMLSAASLRYTFREVPCVLVDGSPQLPSGMRANIDTAVGKINSDVFDSRYLKGTLLLLAPEEVYYHMSDGNWAANITFPMEVRGTGGGDFDGLTSPEPTWGHLLRGTDGLYHKIRKKGLPGTSLYGLWEFGSMFWPF